MVVLNGWEMHWLHCIVCHKQSASKMPFHEKCGLQIAGAPSNRLDTGAWRQATEIKPKMSGLTVSVYGKAGL